MQNHAVLEKAHLLMQQGRFKMAEQELRQSLALYRSNAATRAMLSSCLLRQKLIAEALHEAKEAIRLEPTNPDHYHILSQVYLEQERYAKAEKIILVSLSHQPANADYLYVLATIYFQQQQWEDALIVCETGLNLSAEHIDNLNLRARILNRMGRYEDANITFDMAFRGDPENPFTYANRGWAALEQQEYNLALDSFKTALSYNPELEFARTGLVEAIKARYILYRMSLQFNYLSNTKLQSIRVLLVAGLILCVSHSIALLPFYLLFVLFIWFADVLFNAYLQLYPSTAQILSNTERNVSLLFGSMVTFGILNLIFFSITGLNVFQTVCLVSLGMLFPLTNAVRTTDHRRRPALAVIAGIIGVAAIAANFYESFYVQVLEVIFFHVILGYAWYESFLTNGE